MYLKGVGSHYTDLEVDGDGEVKMIAKTLFVILFNNHPVSKTTVLTFISSNHVVVLYSINPRFFYSFNPGPASH
jgi:hypothetical protein